MTAVATPQPRRRGLFEPPRIGEMALAARVIVYGLLAVWSAFVLFPLYWLFITSFKMPLDVNVGPTYLPWVDYTPSLHAWQFVLFEISNETLRPYINSVIVAGCSTVLAVLLGSMAAYALARFEYKPNFAAILVFVALTIVAAVVNGVVGVDWWIVVPVAIALMVFLMRAVARRVHRTLGNGDILFWMISQRIMPPVVTVVPIYMMFQTVGLLDTHLALILTYTVVNLPIVVWLMYDFFRSIPIDMEESAQLDGASRLWVFFDIVLPLAKPGLAATTLLVLILAWNEYLVALFLSTSNAQTLPILVASMNAGERGILWWNMSVVIMVMILPVVLLALVLQRLISKGILLGAVKG